MTIEEITKAIAEYKGVDASEISSEQSFTDMGLDSLDVVDISMNLEDKFGVSIEITPEISNIKALAEYIDARLG